MTRQHYLYFRDVEIRYIYLDHTAYLFSRDVFEALGVTKSSSHLFQLKERFNLERFKYVTYKRSNKRVKECLFTFPMAHYLCGITTSATANELAAFLASAYIHLEPEKDEAEQIPPNYLSVQEVADYFETSIGSVHRYLKREGYEFVFNGRYKLGKRGIDEGAYIADRTKEIFWPLHIFKEF